jgi:hypothetical protein
VDEAAALVPSLHQRLNKGQLDKINRATGCTFQSQLWWQVKASS